MKVQKLLRLQRAFDDSRGISNLPEPENVVGGDALARLEFALIGLTGEVGEIANVIKKARRARALGKTDELAALAGLGAEIADVLSYLLKLAYQADINPGREYLGKMCRNAHRFWRTERGSALSVSGPPGSGKSTVVEALGSAFSDDAVYLERFEQNPYLGSLDRPNPDFDAASSQRWFLDAMASFIAQAPLTTLLLDQDPTAIALVYGQLLFDRQLISPQKFEDHLSALLELEIDEASKLAGRTVILLDAPAETLAQRCVRKVGPSLGVDFLEEARGRFAMVFGGLPNVITVDASRPVGAVVADVRAHAEALQPSCA